MQICADLESEYVYLHLFSVYDDNMQRHCMVTRDDLTVTLARDCNVTNFC